MIEGFFFVFGIVVGIVFCVVLMIARNSFSEKGSETQVSPKIVAPFRSTKPTGKKKPIVNSDQKAWMVENDRET